MIELEKALESKAWPFIEAAKILERINNTTPEKGYVLFETGYGPSGLPHIGTFAEVFRTTIVRRAFEKISDIPTKLVAFSDDMDGLRKVPDNLPNKEMIEENLGKPLTSIPDPFGTHENFGDHMNNRLRQFLDQYGFEYEFRSSTECYKSGIFNEALLKLLKEYEGVQNIMLPTLRAERKATYSPFMPICKKTGIVLQVAINSTNADKGTVTYTDPTDGEEVEIEVTDGNCKLQWKPDWGMRWAAFDVDYEMHGKDLTPSAISSKRICNLIGGKSPINFIYEMFLDGEGGKISKSKGNGLSLEEWLKYGTAESLSTFLYASPHKQKRLHFDVIPKSVDEYITHINKIGNQDDVVKMANPVWHIHNAETPDHDIPVTFNLLLNLASACNPEDSSVLWGFITKYAPDVNIDNSPFLGKLIEYAVAYYMDFVKPNKVYRLPTEQEEKAIRILREELSKLEDTSTAEEIQNIVFAVGKENNFENLRFWFKSLYEILLGQDQGPRIGSFIALYGIKDTITLIDSAIKGELVK